MIKKNWRPVDKVKTESVRSGLSAEEKYLLYLLRRSLTTPADSEPNREVRLDWDKLCVIARRHGVLPLLYDSLVEREELPEKTREIATDFAMRSVHQSYRLLFLSKYLVEKMEAAGLSVVLLKGVATASLYPVPELRKSGDVDLLLLDKSRLKQACGILQDCGCIRAEEQHALHHVVYCTEEGIEIEIHTMLAEPFDNDKINQYMEGKLSECSRNVIREDCMGVKLPILNGGYHAYELLLHMLQHFLRSGFGLRLLCDWVVFWNREWPMEEREKYLVLVRESGIKSFSDIVTCVCVRYFGLPRERVSWMKLPGDNGILAEFLEEVLEAEEFGNSTSDRMVALQNVGLKDYIREFHYQMRLNFPKACKCIPLWPILWVITLVRFLRNNRKIRNVSARSVLKKAGQRGRLIARMRLWK